MTTVIHKDFVGSELHTPFHEGASPPESAVAGWYWLNTTSMVLSRYDGSAWVEVSPTVAPLLPQVLPVYQSGDLVDPWVGVVSGSITANYGYPNNQSWAVPIYLAKDVSIDGLAVPVASPASSGSLAKAALFAPDANGLPGDTIVQAAGIPIDTPGVHVGAVPLTGLARGFYWIAVVGNETFWTYAITNPVSTPIPYEITTGASKSMVRIPVNYTDMFYPKWNPGDQPIAYGGGAYRFAVRLNLS